MAGVLRPGGTLLTLDLYEARSPADYLVGALGFPASGAIRLAKTGSLSGPRQSPDVQRAWEKHYATDVFPTLAEVREACVEAGLSGAKVRRHLLFRYSVVWRKPARWRMEPDTSAHASRPPSPVKMRGVSHPVAREILTAETGPEL